MISTMNHVPFPGMSAEQRDLVRRWLYAAASRESYLQLKVTRPQDKVRHSIRANAFRDALAELGGES